MFETLKKVLPQLSRQENDFEITNLIPIEFFNEVASYGGGLSFEAASEDHF